MRSLRRRWRWLLQHDRGRTRCLFVLELMELVGEVLDVAPRLAKLSHEVLLLAAKRGDALFEARRPWAPRRLD